MSLYKHQSDAIDFALRNNGNAALFHDPGCGKTRTSLEIYSRLRVLTPNLRMLVCCPLSLLKAAWGEDTGKFTGYKYSTYAEWDRKPVDIIGINFESLIQPKRLKEIEALLKTGPWMLVVDESSRMKNPKAQTTKAILKLGKLAKHRVVASGTPAPNSELEFWAQINFVEPGTFNDSFFAFRNTYFHLGRGKQVMPANGAMMSRAMMAKIFQQGWKYQITDFMREKLMQKMKPVCHWVKKEEALDLPDKVDEIRLVKLSPAERKAYNDMKNYLVAELRNGSKTEAVTAEVALAKLMKLRQATAGFMYTESHEAVPIGNTKLNELEDVLEELGNQQVIIWVQFREEVRAVSEMLAKKGASFTTLYSGTEDKDAAIKSFQTGESKYLIANPHSAGHGLTFVNCSSAVFLSLDYSSESHIQAKDRIHRIGQNKKCLYIYIIADDTIDKPILSVLNGKKTRQDLAYELMKELE